MIDKVNTSQLQDILTNAFAKEARNTEPGQSRPADASLQADYVALIKQAAAACTNDNTNLQKVKELLESGKLETPENISQAAQNIASFGV
jgi:hypothetical protein